MNADHHDTALQSMSRRLERLERANRLYRWGIALALVLGLVVSPALMTDANAGKKSDTLTAKKLALMDDGGVVRVLLTAGKDGGGPSMTLFDAQKKPGVTVSLKKFPMVALHNASGKSLATLSAPAGEGGHLILHDARGASVTHKAPGK